MTKSPRSVTKKLQLFSLFRWLALLCFIKLAIFAMILLDMPFPKLLDKVAVREDPPVIQNTSSSEKTPEKDGIQEEKASVVKDAPPLPLGADAARLAKDIQPKTRGTKHPVSVLAEKGRDPRFQGTGEKPVFKPNDLSLPKPLPAPIVEPGVERKQTVVAENTLPVPTLGAATAAKAAASMPVPETKPTESPFTPIEQQNPLDVPDAPDIPPNVPRGGEGMTLPQREGSMPAPDMTQPQSQSPMQMSSEAQDLVRQQQEMLILKQQMDDRLKDLKDSESKVKQMLDEARDVEGQKIKSLVQMYANMKPKTAAKALEKMDERTACQILQRMTPRQSGNILSYTNPEVTAKLTELLSRMRIE